MIPHASFAMVEVARQIHADRVRDFGDHHAARTARAATRAARPTTGPPRRASVLAGLSRLVVRLGSHGRVPDSAR